MQQLVSRAGAWRAVVAGALIMAAACSHDDGVTAVIPHATIGTAPERTTTTNPYAVPATIDAAYVNRVLAGLDAVVGDIARAVLKARTVTPQISDRLDAVYTDSEASFFVLALSKNQADGFPGFFPVPGNRKTSVVSLIRVAPECIFARVTRDMSAVGPNPNPGLTEQWVALVPLDTSRDPARTNPTPWMLAYDGFPSDHSEPKNACAGG